jgi:hypothetical protein
VIRAACAALALVAAAPAAAYVRTKANGTGVPLAWPVPVVPWQLNPAAPHAAPSCKGDALHRVARASFAEWEQGCANLTLLYAGDTDEQGTGASSSGRSVVMLRRGWCSQDPRVVDQVTGQILDPCMNDPDLTCGDRYGCFQDAVACIRAFQTTGTCEDWKVVALTTVLHDPPSGRILSADVELVGWDGQPGAISQSALPQHGWYFTCYPGTESLPACVSYGDGTLEAGQAGACVYQDLQNTLTHEAGHLVGLAHPCGDAGEMACAANDPRTMAPTTFVGETQKRTLSADDIAGVCAIYPPPSGGCGCGGSGTGAGALLLALLALRPRRAVPPAT